MGKYAVEARRVALQLMDAIFESLGLGQASMRKKLEEGMQLITTNIYSDSSKSDLTVGIAPHTDYGYITILIKNSTRSCKPACTYRRSSRSTE